MSELYFAYGSNMRGDRLRARAPSARAHGPARLEGRRLAFDKHGADGSAKANLLEAAGGVVWGVLWEISAADWPRLDGFEVGYERIRVEVVTPHGERLGAASYASELRVAHARPLAAYHALVVEGAREHGLPAEWIAFLESLAGAAGSAPRS